MSPTTTRTRPRSPVRAAWSWSDTHNGAVRDVLLDLGRVFVTASPAPLALDRHAGTDVVLTLDRGRVAVRVRRAFVGHGSARPDLTLRARPGPGGASEWSKIRAGAADWYLVGVSDGAGGLAVWYVVDLAHFRRSGLVDSPDDTQQNATDGVVFAAWRFDTLNAAGCIVAASWC